MRNEVIPFGSIFEKLDAMERKNEVDLSILPELKKLEDELSNFEKQCIQNQEQSVEDAFLLFHASRSSRMILEKVGKRFEEAKAKHENPKIVNFSKMVLPGLNDIYNIIFKIMQNKERRLSQSTRTMILQHLKTVRDIASITQMLPSIDDEKRGASKINLRNRFESIANGLQAVLNEE